MRAQWYRSHIFIIPKYILIISSSEEFFNNLCFSVLLYIAIIENLKNAEMHKIEKILMISQPRSNHQEQLFPL